MYRGFIRIISAVPEIRTAKTTYNAEKICGIIRHGAEKNADFILLPHNALTGTGTGNLFFENTFKRNTEESAKAVESFVKNEKFDGYVIFTNDIICPDCGGIFAAVFVFGRENTEFLCLCPCRSDRTKPVFVAGSISFAVLQTTDTANDILKNQDINKSQLVFISAADPFLSGRSEYISTSLEAASANSGCVYIIANASAANTPVPYLCRGYGGIWQSGCPVREYTQQGFEPVCVEYDIDTKTIKKYGTNGIKLSEPADNNGVSGYELMHHFHREPFFKNFDESGRIKSIDSIIKAATLSAASRIRNLSFISRPLGKPVIGISGGLDSTAAAIFLYEAVKLCGLGSEDIIAVTSKGFGTSEKTKNNACELIRQFGFTHLDIPITESVRQHFIDIGHDPEVRNFVYENAQARERMQILLDIANKHGGFVINTGDLSEGALGFSTFGGDHTGQFAVNACLTKTMLRHIVTRYAEKTENEVLRLILLEVLGTAISPELMPADKSGAIAQKTEEIIGPYILHDFFIYYHIKYGFDAARIYMYAKKAFEDEYSAEDIKKYLIIYFRRFYAAQFKRASSPECSLLTDVNLSVLNYNIPTDLDVSELLSGLDKL